MFIDSGPSARLRAEPQLSPRSLQVLSDGGRKGNSPTTPTRMLSRLVRGTFRACNQATPFASANLSQTLRLSPKTSRPLQWQGHRYQSEFRRPGGRRSSWRSRQYDPYAHQRAKPLLTVEQIVGTLRSTRTHVFGAVAVGGGVIFYYTHQEEVPVSGRTRFNCYSDETVEQHGKVMYKHVMAEYGGRILPKSDRRSQMVDRVMSRLIAAGDLENVNWEVHVIDSKGKNAAILQVI